MGISFGLTFIEALVYGSIISTTDTVRGPQALHEQEDIIQGSIRRHLTSQLHTAIACHARRLALRKMQTSGSCVSQRGAQLWVS